MAASKTLGSKGRRKAKAAPKRAPAKKTATGGKKGKAATRKPTKKAANGAKSKTRTRKPAKKKTNGAKGKAPARKPTKKVSPGKAKRAAPKRTAKPKTRAAVPTASKDRVTSGGGFTGEAATAISTEANDAPLRGQLPIPSSTFFF